MRRVLGVAISGLGFLTLMAACGVGPAGGGSQAARPEGGFALADIAVGMPYADVVLRYGEPDSIAPDRRVITYLESRLTRGEEGSPRRSSSAAAGATVDPGGPWAIAITLDGTGAVARVERVQFVRDTAVEPPPSGVPAGRTSYPISWCEGARLWNWVPHAASADEFHAAGLLQRLSQSVASGESFRGVLFFGDGGLEFRGRSPAGEDAASGAPFDLTNTVAAVVLDPGLAGERLALLGADGRVWGLRPLADVPPGRWGFPRLLQSAVESANPGGGKARPYFGDGWGGVEAVSGGTAARPKWPRTCLGWLTADARGVGFQSDVDFKRQESWRYGWGEVHGVEPGRLLGFPYLYLRLVEGRDIIVRPRRDASAAAIDAISSRLRARWRGTLDTPDDPSGG